jgi:hypothetical protein
MTKLSQKLDAVAKAKQAYVLARTTLEQRLREQMRDELSNLQTQIDIAVRYAVDAGESKASILRALGTKDYNTVKASLERTQGVAEIVGADPLGDVYSMFDNVLYVNWRNHGVEKYNGHATFDVKALDDGKLLLIGREPLWNEDYTIRNDAIALLDGRTDGVYYEEVVDWVLEQSRS